MKRRFIIVLLLGVSYFMNAQNQSSFNFGISSDIFSVPLSEKSLISDATNVYLGYSFTDKLNMRIGYENSMIKEHTVKSYTDLSGLSLGLGYYLQKNDQKEYSTELFVSFANAYDNFSSFSNYHTDLGLRLYIKNMFYIGSGIRYSKHDLSNLSSNNSSINWYWQMGFQIPFLNRKK